MVNDDSLKALKGLRQKCNFCTPGHLTLFLLIRPFRAYGFFVLYSQGFTLGCINPPLRGFPLRSQAEPGDGLDRVKSRRDGMFVAGAVPGTEKLRQERHVNISGTCRPSGA
jgi:hypothetical protein